MTKRWLAAASHAVDHHPQLTMTAGFGTIGLSGYAIVKLLIGFI